MKVLSVASEMYPLVKTGGLADVTGALPGALAALGIEVRTLLPGYPAVVEALAHCGVAAAWRDDAGHDLRLLVARHDALDLVVLDAPHLYARPGNPYLGPDGRDWPDNAERFAALSSAAARIARAGVAGFVPDVLHAHDWQTALVPAYLRHAGEIADVAMVLTVHNLAFQGRFPAEVMGRIGLPRSAFTSDALEYFGDVGMLKAGLLMADIVTTVSPTYAREIRTAADGMGLDAILRWRSDALVGIVNGIDTDVWNPAIDAHLAAPYDTDTLPLRDAGRRVVERDFALAHDDALLVCMITRLTTQKGIDLVLEALDELVASGMRLAVLGSGDPGFEAALQDAAARHPGRVGVRIGYDEALSHRLQGGCDAILVPSRFEPCGLTQLYGLRYGCVPVVSRVGGLADTIVDANDAAVKAGVATGVLFGPVARSALVDAVHRAVQLKRQPDLWRRIQRNGMGSDVGWSRSAAGYADVYRRAIDAVLNRRSASVRP